MTWSRFDDAARQHPKAMLAGNDAWGLWVAAIMYSNQFGTDGFIPDAALPTLLPRPIQAAKARKLADAACAARMAPDGSGLFERDDERGGFIVHGFLDWNPSKSAVDSKRERDRVRKFETRNPCDVRADSPRTDTNVRAESGRNPDGIQAPSAGIPPRARERAPAGGSQPSPAQPSPAQPEGVAGARDPEPPPPDSVPDSDRETLCPLDLADRFEGYPEMAAALGASEAALRDAAGEFVAYWTIGAGVGRKRSHWARRLRQDLLRKSEMGKLGAGPPGAKGVASALAAVRAKRGAS